MKPSKPPEKKYRLERHDHRLESMSPETVEPDDVDDLHGVSYEQDRAEDRTFRDTGSDRHCPGSSAIAYVLNKLLKNFIS